MAFVGPFVGAGLILKNGITVPANILSAPPNVLASYRVAEAHATQTPFLGIAVLLALLALIFFLLRRAPGVPATTPDSATQSARALLSGHRLRFGTACIFLYVGAEVTIGSLMVNYLLQAKTAAATAALGKPLIPLFVAIQAMPADAPPVLAVLAGGLVSFYWGGAMVGRFLGSAVQRIVRPGTTLAACALGAFLLAGISAATAGTDFGLGADFGDHMPFHPSFYFRLGDRGARRQYAQGIGAALHGHCGRRAGAGSDRLDRRPQQSQPLPSGADVACCLGIAIFRAGQQ